MLGESGNFISISSCLQSFVPDVNGSTDHLIWLRNFRPMLTPLGHYLTTKLESRLGTVALTSLSAVAHELMNLSL